MRKAFAALALASFSVMGCTGLSQRASDLGKEFLESAKNVAKEASAEFMENQLPKLKEEAARLAEEIAKKEVDKLVAKRLAELDHHLAEHPIEVIDENTGLTRKIVKTHMDFDSNGDGELSEKEVVEIGKWIGLQTAHKVAIGVMDSGQAEQHVTGTGITIATLLSLLYAKRKGSEALAKFAKPKPDPTSDPPPGATPGT